ncbi:MAG: hypothetical protein ABEJ76_00045 [Halanaeroarchaeum sp.]
MTTRRALLAGVGTAATAILAGCATFGGSEGRATERVGEAAFSEGVPSLDWPVSPFPVAIPPSLRERHRNRARALLESVPADPSIPNGVIESGIETDRERVAERLARGSRATMDVERLDDWRGYRGDAASLVGRYRAATGIDEGDAVRRRRGSVRDGIGRFAADVTYRATTAVEATLVYSTVEALLEDARRYARPTEPYPEQPVAAVDRAGEAVRAVERAEAAFADAASLHDAYLTTRGDGTSRWVTLVRASRDLAFAVDRAVRPLERYRQADPQDVFDRDVEGTAAGRLFEIAARRLRPASDETRDLQRSGEFATAVLESGRDLAAVASLRGAVDAVEKGRLAETVTETVVRDAAARARSAVVALEDADRPHLSAAIARPAQFDYANAARRLAEDYFDPTDAAASFQYAALRARAAPVVAAYLVDRLDDANG